MQKRLIFLVISLSLIPAAWSNSCAPKEVVQCTPNELPNLKKVGIDPDEVNKITKELNECEETSTSSCVPIEDIAGDEKYDLSTDNLYKSLNASPFSLDEIDDFSCGNTKNKEALYGKEESKAFHGSNNPLQQCLLIKSENKPDFEDKKDGKPDISNCEPLYKDMRDQISKTGKFSIKCGSGVSEKKWDFKLPDASFYNSLKDMMALNTEMDKEAVKNISDKVDLFKKQLEAGDNIAVANYIQIQRGKKIIDNKFEDYKKNFPGADDKDLENRKINATKLSLMENTLTQVDAMYENGLNVKSSPDKVYEESRIVGICNVASGGYMLSEKASNSNLRSVYGNASETVATLDAKVRDEKNDRKYTPSVADRDQKLKDILEKKSAPLKENDLTEERQFGTIYQNKQLFEELHTRKVDSSYKKICPEPVLYESPREKDLFKDNHFAFAEDNTSKMSEFDKELEKFTNTLKQKNSKNEPAIDMKRMILTSSASTFTNTKMKYDDSLCSTMNKNINASIQGSNSSLYSDVSKSHSKYCNGDKLNADYANQSKQNGFALSFLELSMMRSLSLKDKVQSYFAKTNGLDPKFKDPAYVDSIVATNYHGSNYIECPSTPELIKKHPRYGNIAYGKKLETCVALAEYNGTSGPLSPFALGDKNVTQDEKDVYKEYKYVSIKMDATKNPSPDVNVDQVNYKGEAMSLTANYCAYGQTGAKAFKFSGGNRGSTGGSYTPKRRGKIKSLPCPEW